MDGEEFEDDEEVEQDRSACQCARWSFDEPCRRPQEVTVEYDDHVLDGPRPRVRIRVSRECAEWMTENDEASRIVED